MEEERNEREIGGEGEREKAQAQKPQAKKRGRKQSYIMALLLIVVLLIVVIAVYTTNKWDKVQKTELDEDDLGISEEIEEELGEDYLNVALFGVNIKAEGEKAVDSDAVYVVSVNLTTRELQLVSVYGNTILASSSGEKIRMKDAYASGGPQEAISLLNENLDLDIQDYVTVNFKAMADVIDILGGVEINVTEEELPHVNGYARDIAELLGKEQKPLEKEGLQTLNGIQAVGYCRIRITDGGDVRRAGRQQTVIDQMKQKLEKAGFSQMDEIMDKVFPEVETNFELSEAVGYGKDLPGYSFVGMYAFPMSIREQSRDGGKEGDYAEIVECSTYENDVIALHQQLFEGIDYEPTDRVKENAKILDGE